MEKEYRVRREKQRVQDATDPRSKTSVRHLESSGVKSKDERAVREMEVRSRQKEVVTVGVGGGK